MDSTRLSNLNMAHSVVIGLVSYWEFNNTISPSPEIYFSLFLVFLALTFSNTIRSGNRSMVVVAWVCISLVFFFQLYYSPAVFKGRFLNEKIAKGIILVFSGITFLYFSKSIFFSKNR
jgi:threonine/homoserine/homoserine lactone efflux protein